MAFLHPRQGALRTRFFSWLRCRGACFIYAMFALQLVESFEFGPVGSSTFGLLDHPHIAALLLLLKQKGVAMGDGESSSSNSDVR